MQQSASFGNTEELYTQEKNRTKTGRTKTYYTTEEVR